jgi:circadian clock protein KaiB
MTELDSHAQAPVSQDGSDTFQRARYTADQARFVLRLFVSGMTSNSLRAVENTRKICEEHLAGRYQLEIIDIYQQPALAKQHQIVAVPTLLKEAPQPVRKFIGDMSQTEQILQGLDIRTKR